jgi:hypothetical protein
MRSACLRVAASAKAGIGHSVISEDTDLPKAESSKLKNSFLRTLNSELHLITDFHFTTQKDSGRLVKN